MKVPELNRLLVLERPTEMVDGAGGRSHVFAEVGYIWARVRAKSGREVARSEVDLASQTYEVVVRAAPYHKERRPTPRDRLIWGARRLQVQSVAEWDEQGRYLKCLAREEVTL
ncbi:head-tail adaptor protein [Qingshengfaniella alkalisoli]|uniref:Head-tail adaptor protein n=1 Tax=Qingshengfaniella alkalisoli TaxID=2599296 RepID=A0A5B8IVM4_9RHOB|nr:head-tail adaptor protein [Qingshengfaniella alkalisoli]QDY68921.1 head-tail adaptor protein [Qingshengfaniella alkalisoli]